MIDFESLNGGLVEHIAPIHRRDAVGLARQVYEQAEREFGLAPPLTANSADPPLLAAARAATREAFIVGPYRPVTEAIAQAVSETNTCPFYVDIDSMMTRDDVTTVAILDRAPDRIVDAMLARAVRVASGTLGPVSASAPAATLEQFELPACTATADESLPLSDTWARSGIRRVDADAAIGPALGGLLHVTENERAGLASAETVAQLSRNLSEWHGEQPAPGRAWLAEATPAISPEERPLARQAPLAGRATYVAADEDASAVSSIHASDADLVRIVARGADAASRRIVEWIGGAS